VKPPTHRRVLQVDKGVAGERRSVLEPLAVEVHDIAVEIGVVFKAAQGKA
jgi:hypothetical protein